MITCSRCNTQCPDDTLLCPHCQVDLTQYSSVAVALKRFQDNPRVKNIRLVVALDACPTCQQLAGTYSKDQAPILPEHGCSHAGGCRCFYEPLLDEIYP